MKRILLLISAALMHLSAFAQLDSTPAWSKNMVMYEVNVRHYTDEGTFKAFEPHLPRLKAMGVNTLWFMPVQPIGKKNIKGGLGSPYAIQDYENINPRMGNMEDFKALVAKAHALDMKVLIEWVANHTSWDNVLTQSHPEWYLKDSQGSFIPPKPEWEDVIELDYDKPALSHYMQEQIVRWVKETNIDGFRFDVAGLVPHLFWRELRPKLDAIKPVFIFTDGKDIPLMNDALDLVYDYDFLPIMEKVAKGQADANAILAYLDQENALYGEHKNRFYFTTGHIANAFQGTAFERLGLATEAFTALTFMLPGIPLIYSGQEAGLNKRLAFFDKDIIPWKTNPYSALYTRLAALKQRQSLWAGEEAGEAQWLDTKNNHTLALLRSSKNNNEGVLALFNFSNKTQTLKITSAQAKGRYIDALTYQKITIDRKTAAELTPWSYQILVSLP